MVLLISNSTDVTADYVVDVFRANAVDVVRLDTDTLLERIAVHYSVGRPQLRVGSDWYIPTDFKTVLYRRPERLKHPSIADSAEGKFVLDEWSEAIEGFLAHIPFDRWINHPAANVNASHKLEQLTTAASLGFSVPQTLISTSTSEIRDFFYARNKRVIAKPLSTGYIERDGGDTDALIYTNQILESSLEQLDDIPQCPTLLQEMVKKVLDVRITVVDRQVHAVSLSASDADGTQRCDIRRNNMEDVSYGIIVPPLDIVEKIRSLCRHYRLRFAAIDMAIDRGGNWHFFEVNPNGQWAWMDLVGVTSIGDSFVRSVSGGTGDCQFQG